MRRASAIFSLEIPPPVSRKQAGLARSARSCPWWPSPGRRRCQNGDIALQLHVIQAPAPGRDSSGVPASNADIFCLASEESSITIFESMATTSPWVVMTSGLISAVVASLPWNAASAFEPPARPLATGRLQSRASEKIDNSKAPHRLRRRKMHGQDFFRRGSRHLFNVHASAGREHQNRKPVLRIEGGAEIEFPGNLDFFAEQHAFRFFA